MIGIRDHSPATFSNAAGGPTACLGAVRSLVLAAGLAASLGAAPARAQEGNILSTLFKFGGTTVPPSQPESHDPAYCPPVEIAEGAAATRILAGGTVRTQFSLARLARECARRQDGSITVKVGVEVNVLLGPAGAPGRFDVPVTFQIRHEGKVVTSRVERASVVVGSGEAQGFASKPRRRKPAVAEAPAGGGDAAQ